VNTGRPVCCRGTALALLGTKKPAAIVTTGAGGGRISVTTGGADAIGVLEATEDKVARDVWDALNEGDEVGTSELDVLKTGRNDKDGDDDDVSDVGSTDVSADETETAVVYCDAEYWLAVLVAIDVELLVESEDLREEDAKDSTVDEVLSEAVTVRIAVIFEVT
jgi:hypothetical protein